MMKSGRDAGAGDSKVDRAGAGRFAPTDGSDMAEIFLSYRRQDSRSATGRLEDALRARFGEGRVFRDSESIAAGDDFAAAIRRAVGTATVVLAVIGPDWLAACDEAGRRRLDDAGDFVRLEIAAALAAGIPVIPVLVEGATMPGEADLPPDLRAFARCQAVELGDRRWRQDLDALAATLQRRFAIEALSHAAQGGALHWPERVALDLLELTTHPRRVIVARQTGQARDHLRAFVFLCVCLVLGNLALASAIEGPLTAPQWVGFGLLAGLMVVALLVAPLWLAWRLAGVRVEFRQVTLIFAYLYGMNWLALAAMGMVLAVGAQLVAPDFFRTLTAARLAERAADAEALFASGPALAAGVIAALIQLSAAVWLVAAWGSFRLSFGVTRGRAIFATGLWLVMLGAVAFLIVAAAG